MGFLNAKKRKSLSLDDFAVPEKRAYPIEDKAHARNALARVSQFGVPQEKSQVRSKVFSKWGIPKKGGA